jgi:hypothetical protein
MSIKRVHPLWIVGIVAFLLCAGCGVGALLIVRSVQSGFRNLRLVGDPFLQHLQRHEWQQAHALLSPTAQARYSPQTLQQRWTTLEQAIGTVQG